jgi:hypothetical protein
MPIWIELDSAKSRKSRPRLSVDLRTQGVEGAHWVTVPLIVDSGSDISIIPIEWVSEYGLALKLAAASIRSFRTSSGAESFGIRTDLDLKLDGKLWRWPCIYSLPTTMSLDLAEGFLEQLMISSQPPRIEFSKPRATPVRNALDTIEDWFRVVGSNQNTERPGLLGRKGFLDEFEVLLCNHYLRVSQRSSVKEYLRRTQARLFGYHCR